MKQKETRGTHKVLWGFLYVTTFLVVFAVSAMIKMTSDPFHGAYKVDWSESVGTIHGDIPYGEGEANKFDLYVPADSTSENYGLVVYLHAGGFTSGDKQDDADMLKWLCSKGYVAAGINYTLRTDTNTANVLTQSNEIKAAVPKVIEAAEQLGYAIDKMAVAGGSAGHALAMIYAYRDAAEAPVPVVLTFGAVGPASFYQEDWGVYGLDQNDEACAGMFSVMAGVEITPEEIRDGSYAQEGSSMPEGYSTRLNQNNPGVLGHSLLDELPAGWKNVEHIVVDKNAVSTELLFDRDMLFNILIFDDGPTES